MRCSQYNNNSMDAYFFSAKYFFSKYGEECLLGLLFLFSGVAIYGLIFREGLIIYADGAEYFKFAKIISTHLLEFNLKGVVSTPVVAHWGGVLLGSIPLLIDWNESDQRYVAALFFSLPVFINTYLIYKVAIKLEFSKRAALISAAFYILCFSHYYQLRNVLPYEYAVSFFLVSVLITLSKGTRYGLNGTICFFIFFIYYGYWILALCGLIFASLYACNGIREFVFRVSRLSLGFLLPFIIFLLVGFSYEVDFISDFVNFSSTISQGDFHRGHLVPFEFLYYAENFKATIWLFVLVACFFYTSDEKKIWLLCGLGFIYVALFLGSNVFNYFVVLGRLVKQLLPILCLLSGLYLAKLNGRLLSCIFFFVIAGFLYNYISLIDSYHPAEVKKRFIELRDQKRPLANKEILLANVCEPSYFLCPSIADNCSVVEGYFSSLNHRFLQYEESNEESRRALRQRVLFHQIVICSE